MSMQTQIQRIKDAKEAMRLSIIAKGVDVPISAKIDTYPSYIAQIVRTTQRATFAVTDDITKYTSTEFVDVFDRATDKWYKLNNLNQFEPYGVYGTSPDDTKYVGKLIVYNGNEYEWTGSDWKYLGQVDNQQVTYTYPEYIERTSNTGGFVTLGEKFQENTVIKMKHCSTRNGDEVIVDDRSSDSTDWRVFGASSTMYYDFGSNRISSGNKAGQFTPNIAEWEIGNWYVKDLKTGNTLVSGTKKTGFTRPCNMWLYGNPDNPAEHKDYGQVWYVQIYQDGVLVKDLVPWTENGVNGLFDFVSMTFIPCTGDMSVSTTMAQRTVETVVYPKEYAAIAIPTPPPALVTFNTMQDALGYSYVYYGLRAKINGSLYVYNSNNKWEVLSFTITGTKYGTNVPTIKINNVDYNVEVIEQVDENTYTWGLDWDVSIPITNIKARTQGLVTIDFSKADVSQWKTITTEAFYNNTKLESFDIPSSITSIGDSAFFWCDSLSLSGVPESVTSIDRWAFRAISKLTTFSMPSVTTLGPGVLEDNINLVSVSMQKMTSVPENTFYGDKALTSVYMPSVTSIGNNAFYYCSSLALTELPSGVTSIGRSAFYGCSSLALTELPSGITSISNGVFNGCSSLALTELPSGITSIGGSAFSGCSSITLTELPSGITSIGHNTFNGCAGITLSSLPSGVTSIGEGSFNGCTGITLSSLPSGVTTIGKNAFNGCTGISLSSLPSGVTSIEEGSFRGCTGITLSSLPSGVTTIGKNAFDGCTGITLSSLPSGVTSIEERSFRGCTHITLSSLPSGLTTVGPEAFYGCVNMSNITLPSTVTTIGRFALYGSGILTITCLATIPPTVGDGGVNTPYLTAIYVPTESVDAYKSATNWSTYADKIQAISE